MGTGYKHYRVTFDYHTHTLFSHGKGSIEDNVKMAAEKGLAGIAITDHGPGHLFFGIKRKDILVMRAEIERLKKVYPTLTILLGVEANIINKGRNIDITEEEKKLFDVILAGYHFGVRNGHVPSNFMSKLFGKTEKTRSRNTEMVVKAIMENEIKILTHPGDKADFDLFKIAEACAARGTLMEISSWHENLTVDEIRLVEKTGVQFVVSSDAHKPERIGDCSGGIERALEAGIAMERVVNVEAF